MRTEWSLILMVNIKVRGWVQIFTLWCSFIYMKIERNPTIPISRDLDLDSSVQKHGTTKNRIKWCVSNNEDDLKHPMLYGPESMLGLVIYCNVALTAVHGAETPNSTQPAHGLERAHVGRGSWDPNNTLICSKECVHQRHVCRYDESLSPAGEVQAPALCWF